VHYYEDGNVQLNSSKDINIASMPKEKDVQKLAENVVKHILKSDAEFQTALNNSFSDVSVRYILNFIKVRLKH
jgi:capping protein alpha